MYLSQYRRSRGFKAGVHDGVDIELPYGTAYPALIDGPLVQVAWWNPIKNYPDKPASKELVAIQQGQGFFITYGHNSAVQASKGTLLKAGLNFALSGNSGYVLPEPSGPSDFESGAHLHIQENEGTYDPNKKLGDYKVRDITPRLNAYKEEQDMTGYEIAKSLYKVLGGDNPNPPDEVLKDKGSLIDAEGTAGLERVATDIRVAAEWLRLAEHPELDATRAKKYDEILKIIGR